MINIPIATTEDFEEYMLSRELCPNCENKLEQMCIANGPEDCYVTGVHCENCNYQYEY